MRPSLVMISKKSFATSGHCKRHLVASMCNFLPVLLSQQHPPQPDSGLPIIKVRRVWVSGFNLHFFEVFDFPDTNLVTGRRTTSTLPTQALYLMNSDFVMTEARFAADLLLARHGLNDDQRIDRAYRLTLGRAPTETEQSLAVRFLDASPRTDAWAGLFQALFSCVEFRYVN